MGGLLESGGSVMINLISRVLVLYILLLFSLLPGCTNIREVETLDPVDQPWGQVDFISEEMAVKAVAATSEVAIFRKSTAASCLVKVEDYPTTANPVYLVTVAEDQQDHLVIYGQYRVDAYNGEIIGQE
jgi:hypothetical protein